MKILVIGPSPVRSKGGMATVIEEIVKDKKLNEEFEIDVYESYIDGNNNKSALALTRGNCSRGINPKNLTLCVNLFFSHIFFNLLVSGPLPTT